jgi:hypothetical protein
MGNMRCTRRKTGVSGFCFPNIIGIFVSKPARRKFNKTFYGSRNAYD